MLFIATLLTGDNRLNTYLRLNNAETFISGREKFVIGKFQNYAAGKWFEEDNFN